MDALMDCLFEIPVSQVTYEEWIHIGMALKEEGYHCSVWTDWSRNDIRFHPGECERKWETFRGSGKPLRAGTIYRIAARYGYGGAMAMDDPLPLHRPPETGKPREKNPESRVEPAENRSQLPVNNDRPSGSAEELIRYLKLLFHPEDIVSYETESARDRDGKMKPCGKGSYTRTAGELVFLLETTKDLARVIGPWNEEGGAWIRFNPMNGQGVRNSDVAAYRYALVESDEIPPEEQEKKLRELGIPIRVLVHSGGKSLHAIVPVFAKNEDEYREKVTALYEKLEANGYPVDRQNKNPSRLSRMPGVTRNGKRQYIVAENLNNRPVTEEEAVPESKPFQLISMADVWDNMPEQPEELICGVLRKGHKMLLSGSSKAGKSFLLMELCIALSEGRKWLDFPCARTKVLYVNLEIDPASCFHRFRQIYKSLGIEEPEHREDLVVLNMRGQAVPLDKLVEPLVETMKGQQFGAVVLDPIYKIITGDENSASEMGYFCNQFDKICMETGCAAIYCHHHSKGSQGDKRAMDRASGSGVFARDPDAQLDMIELALEGDMKDEAEARGITAWRLEGSLREFPPFKPIDFWFDYPIHRLDRQEKLTDVPAAGSLEAGRNKKQISLEERKESIRVAWLAKSLNGTVRIADIAEFLEVGEHCVRERLKEMRDEFRYDRGVVTRVKPQ